jgi:four helix bundle protein
MKSDLPERTFRFAVEIVKLCRLLDGTPGVPKALVNQLFKAGTSIGANVEEGQASQSEADFLSKYSISCKEARETHYWLKLLVASEIVKGEQLSGLMNECNELISIFTTIIKKMKTRKV